MPPARSLVLKDAGTPPTGQFRGPIPVLEEACKHRRETCRVGLNQPPCREELVHSDLEVADGRADDRGFP